MAVHMCDWCAVGYGQINQYNFAAPGFNPASGMFTQIVWADTQKIGCAVSSGCSLSTVVCQYYPAGEVAGYGADRAQQQLECVLPPPPKVLRAR